MPDALTHIPNRDSHNYGCRLCRYDWPCKPALQELAADYRGQPIALAIYVSLRMVEAKEVLGERMSCQELHTRFMEPLQRPEVVAVVMDRPASGRAHPNQGRWGGWEQPLPA